MHFKGPGEVQAGSGGFSGVEERFINILDACHIPKTRQIFIARCTPKNKEVSKYQDGFDWA